MQTHVATPAGHAGPRPFAAPVLASAALGAVFGFLYPATHVAIEPAQLLAGLVAYPPDNPFGLYEARVWTVLHQLFALLLAIGIDERALTQLVSAGAGALNFAALAAFARALGAPPAWSAVAPFLLWALNPLGWGQGYPILLIGHPHTYGMVGLAWVVLACSAIGARRFALGAALLGFAPALHPTLGASVAALTGLCAALDWRALRPQFPVLLRGGAIGAGLAAVSLALHLWMQPHVPAPDAAEVARLFPVYLQQWDAHRQPLDWNEWRAWLIGFGVAIATAWLPRLRGDAARALLLRVFLATALSGVLFALVRQFAPENAIPQWLLAAMPTRILNFPVITFVPLLIAALTRDGATRVAQGAAAGLAAIALVWQWAHGLETWGLPVLGLVAVIELLRRSRDERRMPRAFAGAVVIAVAIGIAHVLVLGVAGHARRAGKILADRTTDPALAAAASGQGLLAVAPGVERAQLVTRRPILLDPQAIDMVAYVPDALPAVARITTDFYGVDFAAPLPRDRNKAVIPIATVRKIWERRSLAEWEQIGREFGVQEILVPAGWKLVLPEGATHSPAFTLYEMVSFDGPFPLGEP